METYCYFGMQFCSFCKKLCSAQVGSYSYYNQVWFGLQFLFNPILGFMHGLIKNKWYIWPSLKKSVGKFEQFKLLPIALFLLAFISLMHSFYISFYRDRVQ